MRRYGVELQPVDFGALLPKLELTIGQLASLSGLTVRQVAYWTSKGILEATNPKKRIYRAEALHRAILLRQCLDQGLSLKDAVDATEEYLAANGAGVGPSVPAAARAAPVQGARPGLDRFILDRLNTLREL